jgi:hypothetical protein
LWDLHFTQSVRIRNHLHAQGWFAPIHLLLYKQTKWDPTAPILFKTLQNILSKRTYCNKTKSIKGSKKSLGLLLATLILIRQWIFNHLGNNTWLNSSTCEEASLSPPPRPSPPPFGNGNLHTYLRRRRRRRREGEKSKLQNPKNLDSKLWTYKTNKQTNKTFIQIENSKPKNSRFKSFELTKQTNKTKQNKTFIQIKTPKPKKF